MPLHRLFDYLPAEDGTMPPPGSRVVVPFGRRRLVGIAIDSGPSTLADRSSLRRLHRVLDEALIDPELLDLLRWAVRYYAGAPGDLVALGLPAALRRERAPAVPEPEALRLTSSGAEQAFDRAPRRREIADRLASGPVLRQQLIDEGMPAAVLREMLNRGWIERCDRAPAMPTPGPPLNDDQRRALAAILRKRHGFATVLLAGVTGSGKTEVYMRAAAHALRRGRQVLVLVPEIGLTPQFVRRLERRLGENAWVYHSALAEGVRAATWIAARAGRARLLVGTRSAVFLPLAAPGLIVVDEEHDSSFKQFDGLRYHARDVAVMRASRLGIPVVLGSATPSLESLSNARSGRYLQVRLPHRAGGAAQPSWQIEDLRGQTLQEGLSPRLIERIDATLAAGSQVLIYRNRRGYAPVLLCNECGWHGECTECSANLTWHRKPARLMCHHCGRTEPVPLRCPACGAPALQAVGAGTERLEAALAERFPRVPVLRFDRDAVRGKDAFERQLARIEPGRACILVGTQMLAKGHHLPGIGLAVMLDADSMLFSGDFRASERLAQSVVQVAGRSGRVGAGRFVLQTRQPEHPLLQQICRDDYLELARTLLRQRAEAALPPATSLALVRAEARTAATAIAFLERVRGCLPLARPDRRLEILGPVESMMPRRAGFWRYQLWINASNRATLRRALQGLPACIEALAAKRKIRWSIDVDPLEP